MAAASCTTSRLPSTSDAVPRVHAVHDAGFFGDLADREDVQPEHPVDGQSRPGDQKETAAENIDAVRMDQASQDFALGRE